MTDPKKTKSDFPKPDNTLSLEQCSNCAIPVLIETDEKASKRYVRCTACLMKFKILRNLNP